MSRPPPPPPPPRGRPAAPVRPVGAGDLFARVLAKNIRDAHGIDQASTLDMSEQLGQPRGFVGTRNIALDRALGSAIPLGRVTEISGWPGAGKSTILDQILAQCQADGGVAVLADTERTRNRKYMMQLGCLPESMIWVGGGTVELMFHEIETLARSVAHYNAIAWAAALNRAGVKCPAPDTHPYQITEKSATKGGKAKVLAAYQFARWGRAQAGALLTWQAKVGVHPSAIRDAASRAALRPVILHTDDRDEQAAAAAAWGRGESHPLASPADRPIMIGWDSVAGTPTEEELEGQPEDVHPATAAKVIRRNLRRLVQLIDDEAIGFVIINQRYEKIKMAGGPQWGPSSETYGGGGIKYHTTIRVEVDKVGEIYPPGTTREDHAAPMGQIVRIKVPKNKVESPFREEQFGLIFGRGAENAWAVYEDLKERGIIRVGGGGSSFVDPSILGASDRSFRGWTDLANMIAADPVLWATLRALYLEGGR